MYNEQIHQNDQSYKNIIRTYINNIVSIITNINNIIDCM